MGKTRTLPNTFEPGSTFTFQCDVGGRVHAQVEPCFCSSWLWQEIEPIYSEPIQLVLARLLIHQQTPSAALVASAALHGRGGGAHGGFAGEPGGRSAGTLNVTLVSGYTPNPGDSFEIMTFGSLSGVFATDNGNEQGYTVTYNATNVTLTAQ